MKNKQIGLTQKIIALAIILFFLLNISQQANAQKTNFSPRILVLPFASENENLSIVLEAEENSHLRVAMTHLKSSLEIANIQTVDLKALKQQLKVDEVMTTTQQKDLKSMLVAMSAADIYVETEAKIVKTDKGNSVTVILNAYDAFSGQSLVNRSSHSPKFYTENFEKLAEKAIKPILEEFVQALERNVNEMLDKGRPLVINIGLSYNSDIDLDTEIGEEKIMLSTLIEKWIESQTVDAYFRIQGLSATKMVLTDVNIPLYDEGTKSSYTPTKFAQSFFDFFRENGIDTTRDVQGTNVYFQIL